MTVAANVVAIGFTNNRQRMPVTGNNQQLFSRETLTRCASSILGRTLKIQIPIAVLTNIVLAARGFLHRVL